MAKIDLGVSEMETKMQEEINISLAIPEDGAMRWGAGHPASLRWLKDERRMVAASPRPIPFVGGWRKASSQASSPMGPTVGPSHPTRFGAETKMDCAGGKGASLIHVDNLFVLQFFNGPFFATFSFFGSGFNDWIEKW